VNRSTRPRPVHASGMATAESSCIVRISATCSWSIDTAVSPPGRLPLACLKASASADATRAGLTPGAVWQVEHRGSGSPATLKKLADVLGVRPVDLLKKGR
jgi:hypothetical protein